MTLNQKRLVIIGLAFLFLLSLVVVQWRETARKYEELGRAPAHIAVPATSKACIDCHGQTTRAIIDHWKGSKHAETGVACFDCHKAEATDADAFNHYGATIATVVTPRDCSRCHGQVAEEFQRSHHAAAGNILASLDNFLAETVEGGPPLFNPHSPTPGKAVQAVNGHASSFSGCQQCHGSKLALQATDGGTITVDDLQPDESGQPTNGEALGRILKDQSGKPLLSASSWPNTGIGRLNLDGSRGSCSACHSRHDFSPRRARQPENCGKCHLGPDHPQKEIYEESKHGVAFRDLKEKMNLDGDTWVLGEDYSQAPTCATCHLSANTRNGAKITHDPGERISWTNRPPISVVMDTDINGQIVTATDPEERRQLTTDTAEAKRNRMKAVCSHCHTPSYVNAFYQQYDELVILYNEKFAKPGTAIMAALQKGGLLTPTQFDEEIEWTWFYLWHHEGRRARHGASMMAPDYTHWHGMYEVAERFYMGLIPQARELVEEGRRHGKAAGAAQAEQVIEEILARPEHEWFEAGADDKMRAIREQMEKRYGTGSKSG
jgi:hypothetical protein